MEQFQLPDRKKISGKLMGLIALGGIGLMAWSFVVPFLAAMVWNTVSLGIGVLVVGFLGYILTSKTFWNRCKIITEAIGSSIFGIFVEMNPFAILEQQLDQAQNDRQDLFKQMKVLQGQDDKLSNQLFDEDRIMKISSEKVGLLRKKLANNSEDEELMLELESATNDYTNSVDFIEKVAPIAGDIKKIIEHAEKGYRKSEYAIKNARNTIRKQRAAFEAVTAGSNAMTKMLRAFSGDPDMNKAADIALNKLRSDISAKMGIIKTSIKETSKLMNERDLNDAAKVSLVVKNMEQLKIEEKMDTGFLNSMKETSTIPNSTQNKWLHELKS